MKETYKKMLSEGKRRNTQTRNCDKRKKKKEREADFNGNFNERNAKHILS